MSDPRPLSAATMNQEADVFILESLEVQDPDLRERIRALTQALAGEGEEL